MEPEVMGLIWLVAAIFFVAGELALPGFILLPFGVSAFIASIVGFAGAPIGIQWVIFIVGGIVLFVIMWKFFRQNLSEMPRLLGVGASRLVGLKGAVIDAIPAGSTGAGEVQIGTEIWPAETDDGSGLAVGMEIEVLKMRGTRVIVRPVSLGTIVL
jgi:membrane protein implicated in regulation of membrane protease activity